MRYNILSLKFLFIIISPFLSSSSVYGKTSNNILNTADSLVKAGQFSIILDFLLPYEKDFENESEMSKYFYYGLIASSYIRNQDLSSAIPYIEKKAQNNHTSIYDSLDLANLFASECKDWDKAILYAQKALLLDDEITRLGYNKDHTISDLGRLHYILGILSCRYNNKIMAEEHLNWLENNECPIDSNLFNHLVVSISDSCDNVNHSNINDRRVDAIKLFEKECFSSNLPIKKENVETYEVKSEVELDSIASSPDLDVKKYLNTVFSIEDGYDASDIYKARTLLNRAHEEANSRQFYLKPSTEMCELNMRLGRCDFFLKKYDSAITWFLLAYTDSRQMRDALRYNVQALGEIADIYLQNGEKYKALIYADEMLEDIVKITKIKELDVSILLYLGRYANILSNIGFKDTAELFYKLLIELVPHDSSAYKLVCNNYATYLMLNNRKEEACYYYMLIKDNCPTPQTMSNLSIAYLISNKVEEAENTFHEYFENNISQMETVLSNFSEQDWNSYWDKYGYEVYLTSNYLGYNINTKKSLIDGYNATIITKSLPLLYKTYFDRMLSSSSDPQIQSQYKRYVTSKQNLSKGSQFKSFNNQSTYEVKILEDSLLQKISISNDKLRFLLNDYGKIVNSLEKDEVAVEFCEYLDILSISPSLDSIVSKYAAYIIDPECSTPIFIVLGDKIEISNYIFNLQKDEISLNQLYSQNIIGEFVWGEILPYLKNKRRIYFTPIGQLSVLNHQILKCSDLILGEKYDLRRVSSTSLLPDIKDNNYNYSYAVLFGGINYNTDYDDMKTASTPYNYNDIDPFISLRGDKEREGWNNLQFSRQEIDSIDTILKRSGCSSTLYYGNNANEEAFKALDYNAPSIIHIASHGFTYFSNVDEEKRNKITSVSPYTSESVLMSWTGLLFSGANNTWTGKYQIHDFEDGILTANEISLLHLDGASLVVLSACNTGLGISDTYGSTIGLQKAFKMAGAKSILMSLWHVPDESTALLMTKFYESLFNGHSRHEALKIAMKNVREIYPDPYYWGAFVILD